MFYTEALRWWTITYILLEWNFNLGKSSLRRPSNIDSNFLVRPNRGRNSGEAFRQEDCLKKLQVIFDSNGFVCFGVCRIHSLLAESVYNSDWYVTSNPYIEQPDPFFTALYLRHVYSLCPSWQTGLLSTLCEFARKGLARTNLGACNVLIDRMQNSTHTQLWPFLQSPTSSPRIFNVESSFLRALQRRNTVLASRPYR